MINQKSFARFFSVRPSALGVVAAWAWLAFIMPAKAEVLNADESVNNAALESCLAQADWAGLASLLRAHTSGASAPCEGEAYLRFLAGHAFLATNRNNEATRMFACPADSGNSASLAAWQEWTQQLVQRHPNWSAAHYLYADALGRQGRFAQALSALDRMLALNPRDYLARNARGVMRLIVSAQDSALAALQDSALVDLQEAAQHEGFAEAWANLGVLDLYQGYNPVSADDKFSQAIQRDSTFAMAFNGRACAAASLGAPADAEKSLIKANVHHSQLSFVIANARVLANAGDTTNTMGAISDQEADGEVRGFEFNVGGGVNKSLFGAGIDFNVGWKTPRGGIYVKLKEGGNLVVDREGAPRVMGTWFLLNYPNSR